MNILYLHQYFNTPRDPGGTRSYEMARRLVASGHRVDIVTSQRTAAGDTKNTWSETVENGINVHWLPVEYSNDMSYRRRILAFIRFALGAARKSAALKADVVFATSTPLTIALPAIYAARRQRIPMVFEVRDLWPELPIAVGALRSPVVIAAAKFLEKLAYRASSHVVALSPGIAKGVIRQGVPATQVTEIPNSCDVEMFDVPSSRGDCFRDKLGLAKTQPLVIYAGTFGHINDVGYLVQVAAAMKSYAPDVRFALVGSGSELKKITKQAQDLEVLNNNLWILSPIPKSEMPNLLAAATIATSLFLPVKPMWNNSANKFFDALASNKPIAINYGGWQAELLEKYGAGLVLPWGDITRSSHILANFLYDSEKIEKASRAARELAYSKFARDKLASMLESVLCETVQMGKKL